MTTTAELEINKELQPMNIPMKDIYSDSNFNVRGSISPSDVVELAKNIDKNGLLQPITVQPYHLVQPYKWRIVVGHRRHKAFEVLDRSTIPCIIKEGLTDIQALALNYVENVNRRDLNILQEAVGVKRFKESGLTLQETAKIINKGTGWIQVRFVLLTLPEEIQQECAAGLVTQDQIKDLAAISDKDEQFAAVRRIKDARAAGEKRAIKVRKKKPNPTARKPRDRSEITRMLGHVLDTVGPNLLTRGLAWANGEISDLDLYRDLQGYADEQGLSYEVPEEAVPFLQAG